MGEFQDEPFGAHLLGLSTLLVGAGSLAGLRFGGLQGASAGALFGGAAVNLYRAIAFSMKGTPADDREAVVSGTYAVAAAGLAGYILWRRPFARKVASAHEREFRQNGGCAANGRRNCGFRPVGP